MQRGGAWDNSDLVTKKGKVAMKKKTEKVVFNNKVSKGVAKKEWSQTDKEYAAVSLRLLRGQASFIPSDIATKILQPQLPMPPDTRADLAPQCWTFGRSFGLLWERTQICASFLCKQIGPCVCCAVVLSSPVGSHRRC